MKSNTSKSVVQMAFECADETFRSIVESACPFHDFENHTYDLTNPDSHMKEDVQKSINYFKLRGDDLPYRVVFPYKNGNLIEFIDKIQTKVYRVFPDSGASTGVWNQINHDSDEEYVISYEKLKEWGISPATIVNLKTIQMLYSDPDFLGDHINPILLNNKKYLDKLGKRTVAWMNGEAYEKNVKFTWEGVD